MIKPGFQQPDIEGLAPIANKTQDNKTMRPCENINALWTARIDR
jgi:hypothetical protein